jgi:hypothetical protein
MLKEKIMKKGVSVFLAMILCSMSLAIAQEQQDLGVTLEFAYHTKWLSKGAEGYGQQGALFETIDVDFYGSGFGLNTMHRHSTGDNVDKERFDFRPYYKGTAFQGETYEMNYNVSAGYEYYPGLAREKSNTTWEWIYAFSWPNILPDGFVPRYIAHYEYGAGSGYTTQSGADIETGWVHRFILGYDLQVPELPNPLHLSSELAYTDGLGGAEHDWSYATFGLSSSFSVMENLSFIPGVYQQISMEDSVNSRKDVTYGIFKMRYKF